MPVLSIDYALIPTGMFNVGDHPVLPAVAKATKFLAAQSPRRLVDTKGKRPSQVGDKRRLTKTKIFIMGDSGGNLRGIDYKLPVASAQVKSCILIAGLHADGETTIHQPAATRDHTRPYCDHPRHNRDPPFV